MSHGDTLPRVFIHQQLSSSACGSLCLYCRHVVFSSVRCETLLAFRLYLHGAPSLTALLWFDATCWPSSAHWASGALPSLFRAEHLTLSVPSMSSSIQTCLYQLLTSLDLNIMIVDLFSLLPSASSLLVEVLMLTRGLSDSPFWITKKI